MSNEVEIDELLRMTTMQMVNMEKRPYYITTTGAVPADHFRPEKNVNIEAVVYPPGYRFRWSHGVDYSQWKRDPLMGWVWRGAR